MSKIELSIEEMEERIAPSAFAGMDLSLLNTWVSVENVTIANVAPYSPLPAPSPFPLGPFMPF